MPRPSFHISGQNPQGSSQAESEDRPALTSTGRQAVIKIPVENIHPDYFQTRLILPEEIATPYYSRRIDNQKAANLILQAAGQDAGFERVVNELVQLGESIASEGQIEPITGYFKDRDFFIETGERRFWGTVLYHTLQKIDLAEASLKAIPVEAPSRLRQILENEQSSPPNSLTRARSIAAIILLNHQIEPLPDENRHDYYRRINHVRVSAEDWALVESKLNIKQRLSYYYLAMLNLPNDLLELVNNYDIPEKTLREALRLPVDQIRQIIYQIIAARSDDETAHTPLSSNQSAQRRVHNIIPSQKVAAKFYRELIGLYSGKARYQVEDLALDLCDASLGHIDEVISTLEVLVKTMKDKKREY
ncbi:MAG: hypothetical protein LWX83_19070 [Anaerolineae bacterium]|nr:hypothetical protein [Anaerolineae bacterium]